MADRVGFIGLGIMGSRMAANLRGAGFELTVWNRTRATAEAWVAEHGGTVADTPAAVGTRADVVITMVVDGPQVESVLLGPDGDAEGAAEGTLCVDMSTIAPADTRRIGAELAERGLRFMDAPVTGSSPKAQDGTLTIMAGGEPADFDRARPLFEAMGAVIEHVGPLGHGEIVKVVNNALAAVNTAAAAQALIVAKALGADLDAFGRIVAAGSGGSAMFGLKAAPMRRHEFTPPLFKLEHMLKDVRFCLEEGAEADVPFPFAFEAASLLDVAVDRGLADSDFCAVATVLEDLAGVRLD
jgi:3-hydroxyisobutyrate dehydrogenase-like beta-hydroxyacid dehydrogenase